MSRFIYSNIFLVLVWLAVIECFPDCTQNIYEYGCRGYGMKRSGDALLKRHNQELSGLNDKQSTQSDGGSPLARHSFLKEGASLNSLKGLENLRLLLDQQKRIQQLNDLINSRILANNRDYSLEDRK